jgi:hypothetical protein
MRRTTLSSGCAGGGLVDACDRRDRAVGADPAHRSVSAVGEEQIAVPIDREAGRHAEACAPRRSAVAAERPVVRVKRRNRAAPANG